MKMVMEIEVEPVDESKRDDAERVADCLFYQLLSDRLVRAGTGGPDGRYRVIGYTFERSSDDEHDHLPGQKPSSTP